MSKPMVIYVACVDGIPLDGIASVWKDDILKVTPDSILTTDKAVVLSTETYIPEFEWKRLRAELRRQVSLLMRGVSSVSDLSPEQQVAHTVYVDTVGLMDSIEARFRRAPLVKG